MVGIVADKTKKVCVTNEYEAEHELPIVGTAVSIADMMWVGTGLLLAGLPLSAAARRRRTKSSNC